MSEEKKKEVLDQEKNLDESEMEEVSGGKGLEFCPVLGEKECPCIVGGGGKHKCGCIFAGGGV